MSDELKSLRVELDELWHAVGVGQVGYLLRNARFLLGLTLEENNYPFNPYRAGHNVRKQGRYLLIEDPDLYRGNNWWMVPTEAEHIQNFEIARKRLNEIAAQIRLIIHQLYHLEDLPKPYTLDYLERAEQEVLLARCWLVNRIVERTRNIAESYGNEEED